MRVAILAALAENGVIGRAGSLPWRLPADLRHVKRLTDDHVVIMGRRTFESVGRALPNRTTIIVSATKGYARDDALVAESFEAALELAAVQERARRHEEVFVLGGADVYRRALECADRVYLTRVHATVEGDTYFPPFDEQHWRLVSAEPHPADDKHAHAFTFEVYERRG